MYVYYEVESLISNLSYKRRDKKNAKDFITHTALHTHPHKYALSELSASWMNDVQQVFLCAPMKSTFTKRKPLCQMCRKTWLSVKKRMI